MIWVLILVILGVFVALAYIDQKSNYEQITPSSKVYDNGEFYFYFPYFLWQYNKKRRILEECQQGSTIEYPNAKFIITHCGVGFPSTKGANFIEREVRCWGQPVNTVQSNESLTINQYGYGDNHLQLNKTEIYNKIIEIKEYISNEHDKKFDNKETLLNFLENIYQNKNVSKEESKSAYELFMKYEPLLSLSTNVIALFRSFL